MNAIRFHVTIGETRTLVLPPEVRLVPGPAEVIVLQDSAEATLPTKQSAESLSERLLRHAREMDLRGLPSDLAENHDHYLHGAPKGFDDK